MKFLGIDHGTRYVGLALGDDESHLALAWKTLEGLGGSALLLQIKKIIEEEGIGAAVIGDPVTLSGEQGSQSAQVRTFADALKKEVGEIEIHFIDERMTSRLAGRIQEEQGGDIHALSAAAILQTYLDVLPS